MKILVTGGAGFIGSHVTDALLACGHSVVVLDALVPQVHGTGAHPRYLSPDVEFVRGDVRDERAWRVALAHAEVVIHLAAEVGVGQSMYEITRYVDANTGGTARLWEILAHDRMNVHKVIVASSMSIYGEGAYACVEHGIVFPLPRSEEQLRERDWELNCPFCANKVKAVPTPEAKPLAPTSTYAITKRDQEELSLTLGRAYDIPTVALRFFNVFGSRQALSNPYTGALAMFGTRLKNGQAPLIYEDGLQTRDFIHVTDLARVILRAVESPRGDGQALNVSVGQPHTILDVAETLARVMNVDSDPLVTSQFRAGDIRHCIADTTQLTATYGAMPHLSFEQGVREWWSWAEREHADDRVPDANRELVRMQLVR